MPRTALAAVVRAREPRYEVVLSEGRGTCLTLVGTRPQSDRPRFKSSSVTRRRPPPLANLLLRTRSSPPLPSDCERSRPSHLTRRVGRRVGRSKDLAGQQQAAARHQGANGQSRGQRTGHNVDIAGVRRLPVTAKRFLVIISIRSTRFRTTKEGNMRASSPGTMLLPSAPLLLTNEFYK